MTHRFISWGDRSRAGEVVAKFSEFDGPPLGTSIQFVYFGGGFVQPFSALQKMEECPMGGQVTAQYRLGSQGSLSREQVDQIIKVLDIRGADGNLLKPPVGANCTYVLVLEKADTDVPTNGNKSS
jgi:hypothetical protein